MWNLLDPRAGATHLKIKRKKKVFKLWENLSPGRTVLFGVATYFLFLFIKGKIKEEQKPIRTPVRKKWFAKHESGSRDQVTYWEGTSCEVVPL